MGLGIQIINNLNINNMKYLLSIVIVSILTLNSQAKNNEKKQLSKSKPNGIKVMATGGAIVFGSGLLYLQSTTQKVPSGAFTTRGLSNRIISMVGLATGVTTVGIGGVLTLISKANTNKKK